MSEHKWQGNQRFMVESIYGEYKIIDTHDRNREVLTISKLWMCDILNELHEKTLENQRLKEQLERLAKP